MAEQFFTNFRSANVGKISMVSGEVTISKFDITYYLDISWYILRYKNLSSICIGSKVGLANSAQGILPGASINCIQHRGSRIGIKLMRIEFPSLGIIWYLIWLHSMAFSPFSLNGFDVGVSMTFVWRNISWESILRDGWIRLMFFGCWFCSKSSKTCTSNYIIWAHMTLPIDMILACIHMQVKMFSVFFKYVFHRRRIRMHVFWWHRVSNQWELGCGFADATSGRCS